MLDMLFFVVFGLSGYPICTHIGVAKVERARTPTLYKNISARPDI